ncbi:heavy-metal-associated domain-containing protein [Kribbella sp. NPDC048928]|uniref:heavy-metal-associated domain-containing protein n=1 Tax=Kribbella sp. NPDC048928 TaxID=3364111 RepID=UPI00371038E0
MGAPDLVAPDVRRYDRVAAAGILARVAGQFDQASAVRHFPPAFHVEPELTPLTPAPGSHLTPAQLKYLTSRLQPCEPNQVTSATHRLLWQDTDGTANVAHCGPDGPLVAVVARETVLVLRRALAADAQVHHRAAALSPDDRAVMAATTTDQDPVEILNVGFETTARALIQHSWLDTRRTPAELARELRVSGLFTVVANTWFWGLQSETYRRGMIPVALEDRPDGRLAYSATTRMTLRALKDAAIARPDHDAGVAHQYEPLAYGEIPRCLANVPTTTTGERSTLLAPLVALFVETYVRLLDVVRVSGNPDPQEEPSVSEVFEVPDMTCSHCTNTITGVLESHGATVAGIDLDSKQVTADFASAEAREQAFEAIRDEGYTVVPPATA